MKSLRKQMEIGVIVLPLILFDNLTKLKLNAAEFMLWLQIYRFNKSGNSFPSMKCLGEVSGLSLNQISELITNLIKKKVLLLKSSQDKTGKVTDFYDPYVLFEYLDDDFENKKELVNKKKSNLGIAELNEQFQQEFGRALTPIEIEQLYLWLNQDHYHPEIIQLALREASLANAYSFKYIDTILLSWEGKNIKTKEDVIREQKRRKKQILQKEISKREIYEQIKHQPKVNIKKWL